MSKLIILFSIILLNGLAHAQLSKQEQQQNAIHDFFNGYNNHDYKKIRSTYSWIFKLIFSKKTTQNMYQTQYDIYGRAKIKKIQSISNSAAFAEVFYENDSTESEIWNFNFTKKNKLIGLASFNSKLRFKKDFSSTTEVELMHRQIDSLVQLKYNAAHFNGCVLAINDSGIVYKNCVGYTQFETKTPLNDSSVFELASCSKQFTAFAILLLIEQGKLNYNDPLSKFIPELPYKNITIEQLLNHTSGLPDYMEMLEKNWDKKSIATNSDVIQCFKKYKPKKEFKPGKRYEYSNTGYLMLSSVIERVSGSSYADFLQEFIFKPLGMKNSRVYTTRRSKKEIIENYAYGYVFSKGLKKYMLPDSLAEYDYVYYMDGITGDGMVNSTINDLVIWDNALREKKLLSAATIDKAFSKGKLKSGIEFEYGYGWEIQDEQGYEKIVYHSGSWPGYITYIMHFVDQKRTVIVLSNNEYLNTFKMAKKIGEILHR